MGQEESSIQKGASARSRTSTPVTNETTKKRPLEDEGGSSEKGQASGESKKKQKTNPSSYEEEILAASSKDTLDLLSFSLGHLADGIPKRELKLIVSEAKVCEASLEHELSILRKALASETTDEKEQAALETMLGSEFTPPDTSWTLSALLGRLRHELTTPLPPFSQLQAHREKQGLTQLAQTVSQSSVKKTWLKPQHGSMETDGSFTEVSQFKRMAALRDHPEYTIEHTVQDKLLAVWKKLSTHRSSLVFRRPVNPKEAPGYTDRIRFPMDLSLIRKLIISKHIRTYEGILKQVHLIGHNCVKYNGRESDYALVSREFESVAIEYIWSAVTRDARKGGSRTTSPMPTGTGASDSKDNNE